jgi:single-strand DNA-binding protein
MTDTITLTGLVATPPRSLQTESGLSITSFRLASSQRRYDRSKGAWVDADTNWYTVTAFRQLADNLTASLTKGDRVVVSGRLRIRSWETADRSGTTVEVDADAVGHDLHWGTTSFTRVSRAAAAEGTEQRGGSPGADVPVGDPGVAHSGLGGPGVGDVAPQDPQNGSSANGAAPWGAGLGSTPASEPSPGGAETPSPAIPPATPPSVEEWHSGDTEVPF